MSEFAANFLFCLINGRKKGGKASKALVWETIKPKFSKEENYSHGVFQYIYAICNDSPNGEMTYNCFKHFVRSMTPFYESESITSVNKNLEIIPLMKAIYNGIDINNDKKLQRDEIEIGIEKISGDHINCENEEAKKNFDHVLFKISEKAKQMQPDEELTEIQFLKICCEDETVRLYNELRFEKVFKQFDEDGSEMIEHNELSKMLEILFPRGIDVPNPEKVIIYCINRFTERIPEDKYEKTGIPKDAFIKKFCPVAYDLKGDNDFLDAPVFFTVIFHILLQGNNTGLTPSDLEVFYCAIGKENSKQARDLKKSTSVLTLQQFIEKVLKIKL